MNRIEKKLDEVLGKKEWFNATQVGNICHISQSFVSQMIKKEILKASKTGNMTIVSKSELEYFILRNNILDFILYKLIYNFCC